MFPSMLIPDASAYCIRTADTAPRNPVLSSCSGNITASDSMKAGMSLEDADVLYMQYVNRSMSGKSLTRPFSLLKSQESRIPLDFILLSAGSMTEPKKVSMTISGLLSLLK